MLVEGITIEDKDRQGRVPSDQGEPVNGKAPFRPWNSQKGAASPKKARKAQKELYIVLLVGKVFLNLKTRNPAVL